jgi:pimeloyl-ACP methyl ester carboxylesterase
MEQRVSRDGTKIAYDRSGRGPALVLVTGALCDRATGAPIAEAMSDRFTVYRFDRGAAATAATRRGRWRTRSRTSPR